eukprot:CAMPEP_0174973772 /NCGR_PEP_ID=MMETSP0004_2-20121128/11433_1 /TAXON_ID=420556 /ORGANISM="Ochromonas sp., Strain CCMP1393" /LENGTH=164 /DNA_ID=CAMNT_0016224269 /DNA_START=1 /DNA_END=492 /DNA_ORIENTATION=-
MSESTTHRIVIDDFDPVVVGLFVRFLYQDTLPRRQLIEHAEALYAMAHRYEIAEAQQQASNALRACLTVENALHVLALAELYENIALRIAALQFIRDQAGHIVATPSFFQQLQQFGPACTSSHTTTAATTTATTTTAAATAVTGTKRARTEATRATTTAAAAAA